MVKNLGTAETARVLGVAREPIARVLVGLGVRRGTLAQIEKALAEQKS